MPGTLPGLPEASAAAVVILGMPVAFGLLAPLGAALGGMLPTGLVATEAVGVLVIRRLSSLEMASASTAGSTGGGCISDMSELGGIGLFDRARGRWIGRVVDEDEAAAEGDASLGSLGGGIDMLRMISDQERLSLGPVNER